MKSAIHISLVRKLCGAVCVALTLLAGRAAPAAADAEGAGEVSKGASAAQVIEKLGSPQGVLAQGRRMSYLYERGTVDFVDGRMVKALLVSPAEAELLVRQRRSAEEERLRQAEAARKLAASEGQAELKDRLADEQFANRPPADRLAYWKDFNSRHPDIDVKSQIALAQEDAQAKARQAERQKERKTLGERVAEIQARFKQLDADYAASLANWKRNEIAAEREKLTQERDADQSRLRELEDPALVAEQTNSASAAAPRKYGD